MNRATTVPATNLDIWATDHGSDSTMATTERTGKSVRFQQGQREDEEVEAPQPVSEYYVIPPRRRRGTFPFSRSGSDSSSAVSGGEGETIRPFTHTTTSAGRASETQHEVHDIARRGYIRVTHQSLKRVWVKCRSCLAPAQVANFVDLDHNDEKVLVPLCHHDNRPPWQLVTDHRHYFEQTCPHIRAMIFEEVGLPFILRLAELYRNESVSYLETILKDILIMKETKDRWMIPFGIDMSDMSVYRYK